MGSDLGRLLSQQIMNQEREELDQLRTDIYRLLDRQREYQVLIDTQSRKIEDLQQELQDLKGVTAYNIMEEKIFDLQEDLDTANHKLKRISLIIEE